MISTRQNEFFQENGYLLYGPILSREETRRLRDRLQDVLDGRTAVNTEFIGNLGGSSEKVIIQVVNIWEADPIFREHLYNPAICEIVSKLTGSDTLRVWHDQVQYKPARKGGETRWHQDHPYWPVIEPADLVSAWVALDDTDAENGCMHVVPRSHRWGAYKNGTIDMSDETYLPTPELDLLPAGETVEVVPCPLPAGGVMFHHCLTWHGTPPNLSEHDRPGLAVHYMPGHTRYEPRNERHIVEKHITVQPGEILQGDYFPTVWENGRPVPMPRPVGVG